MSDLLVGQNGDSDRGRFAPQVGEGFVVDAADTYRYRGRESVRPGVDERAVSPRGFRRTPGRRNYTDLETEPLRSTSAGPSPRDVRRKGRHFGRYFHRTTESTEKDGSRSTSVSVFGIDLD